MHGELPHMIGHCKGKPVLGTFLLSLCMLTSLHAASQAQDMTSPLGHWQLIDDETNLPRGIVEMTEANGQLQGRFVQAFLRPGEAADARCVKCTDERKDQPMLGMVILWGLRRSGTVEWSGGHVLDPTKGRTYGAEIRLVEGGRQLRVRGYLGFSLLGRTQTWNRLPGRDDPAKP
jgi:uncharacterized protein (DUF2147 family)